MQKIMLLTMLATAAAALNWEQYEVDSMQVISVVNGTEYEKAVIWLPGAGGTAKGEISWSFESGWWGDITGLKVVFATSPRDDHLWFRTFKNGCTEAQDCSYNLDDVHASADAIASLVDYERQRVGGNSSKVYLGGFSQGAEMTTHMQLAKLDYPLGGAIVMDGYPIPPLVDMVGHMPADAKKNASYYGNDMRWMFWHGEQDIYFDANTTIALYHQIWGILGVESTIKFQYVKPGMQHTEVEDAFKVMMKFIRGEPVSPPSPAPPAPPSPSKTCEADPMCSFSVKSSTPGCEVCANDPLVPWSCSQCCAGCTAKTIAGGMYCSCK